MPASLPDGACYAVIFSSLRTDADPEGYEATARRMVELARTMPGFLGIESARGSDGFGITVSYWESEADIRRWAGHPEHRQAQALGREVWYSQFTLRVSRIERTYGMSPEGLSDRSPSTSPAAGAQWHSL